MEVFSKTLNFCSLIIETIIALAFGINTG